jgi:hypothetical protein
MWPASSPLQFDRTSWIIPQLINHKAASMNEDKQLIIHFTNGKKLEFTFPTQIRNSTAAVLEGLKKTMETDKLAIEADGRLIVVPWASVQQVEVTPVPPALPFGTIKQAKLVN